MGVKLTAAETKTQIAKSVEVTEDSNYKNGQLGKQVKHLVKLVENLQKRIEVLEK